MSGLRDLAAQYTLLAPDAVAHLRRLVADWQLLADLSFADLVLWAETHDHQMICLAQVRATTAPTGYPEDLVGTVAERFDRGRLGQVFGGGQALKKGSSFCPVRALPGGPIIAVITKKRMPRATEATSQLEAAYFSGATALLDMVSDGLFPTPQSREDITGGPRAGDGLVLLNAGGQIEYASPNAMSAYRRMGASGDLVGQELIPLSRSLISDSLAAGELVGRLREALEGRYPLRTEVEAKSAVVQFRALPLRPARHANGALVLLRDVTDVRVRDRQLISKDATIREIHHRVKNNLQTVAALLRLQSRRVAEPAVKSALDESIRRVTSIALVHETLSMSLDETVDFDGIVDRLIPMVKDVASTDTQVRVMRTNSLGVLPADVATPLVMVLTELLQNAVKHAFDDGDSGAVTISCERHGQSMTVIIADDGKGLPAGFSLEASDRLGLQIVRTLVDSELRGSISVRSRKEHPGTKAVLEVPLRRSSAR